MKWRDVTNRKMTRRDVRRRDVTRRDVTGRNVTKTVVKADLSIALLRALLRYAGDVMTPGT